MNTNKVRFLKRKNIARVLLPALWFLFHAEALVAMQGIGAIAGPKINMVDDNGVNVATGQINIRIPTVSIGGAMGLDHHISFFTNGIDTNGYYGYSDKFAGWARYLPHGKQPTGVILTPKMALRVIGPHGSENFRVMLDDVEQSLRLDLSSGYRYSAAGDKRNTLTFTSDHPEILVWTMPDGTKLEYKRPANGYSSAAGYLQQIKYPNGKILTINPAGVWTNTGFQFKPVGIANVDLDETKAALSNALHSDTLVTRDTITWHLRNPTYIFGINNAVQYCSPNESELCGLMGENPHNWPKVNIDWPGGSPRALFLGESNVKITNAEGGVTDLLFDAQDVTNLDPSDETIGEIGSEAFLNYEPGDMFSPRLVKMKSVGSDTWDSTYTYKNDYRFDSVTDSTHIGGNAYGGIQPNTTGQITSGFGLGLAFMYWELNSENGILKSSNTVRGGSIAYTFGEKAGFVDTRNTSWGKTQFRVRLSGDYPGDMMEANIDGVGRFEYGSSEYNSFRRFVLTSNGPGPHKKYSYDDMGNLSRISVFGGGADVTVAEACYPGSRATSSFAIYNYSACPSNTQSCNEFTCNKPVWTKDGLGNQTDYTYHEQSGQTATVTGPADKGGVRPQTRSKYSELYAYYYWENATTISSAEFPLWLLTEQSSCISSNGTNTGCAAANDEIVITYDYGPQNGTANNLLLRGKRVTHPADGSRLTCYEYDIYGNLIGETSPKAGKASCY